MFQDEARWSELFFDAAAQFIFPQKLTLFSDLVIVYTLPASLLDIKIFNAFLVI